MANITKAPDFTPDYPSKGEKIGPAWQACWELMGDGNAHSYKEFYELPACQKLAQYRVGKLLNQAVHKHLLQKTGNPRGFYFRRLDIP